MSLLGDLTAYVDSLKRTAGNSLRDLRDDPQGLLSMRAAQLAESLPALPQSVMPGVDSAGLGPMRPTAQDWSMGVAAQSPTIGLLGPTVFHGTQNQAALDGLRGFLGGLKMMDGLGPHVGTANAANDRLIQWAGVRPSQAWKKFDPSLEGTFVIPYDLQPKKAFTKNDGSPYTEGELQTRLGSMAKKMGFKDTRAYIASYGASPEMKQAQKAVRDKLRNEGYDAIPYINSHEDRGSVSWVVLDPALLRPLYDAPVP